MNTLYREIILDHYKHPRNFGRLEKADAVASDQIVSCGDSITLYIRTEKSANSLEDVRFEGSGCAISIASASMLTEKSIGAPLFNLKRFGRDDILEMLGIELTPTRVKCALLSLEVLHKALSKLT
ncbi:iron-sulfur cluster assembly scaffold protein [Candidatus Gottesmanbacteria bacterium]|nr:iron-sulfur cluster assembly scaffold protein [Candidatus Gottesmanbacteria bacterium]